MFTMFKHDSTALKIIDLVKEKILPYIKERPEYKQADSDIITYEFHYQNKAEITKTLGNVLRDQFPDKLYGNYQKLTPDQKKKIREEIANDYFKALAECTEQFKNLVIRVSVTEGSAKDFGNHLKVTFSFPNEFLDKDALGEKLLDSLALTQQQLIESKSDALKYKSDL